MNGPGSRDPVIAGMPRRGPRGIARRTVLTLRYHGARGLLLRLLVLPLRSTAVGARLGVGSDVQRERQTIRDWYGRAGRPVAILESGAEGAVAAADRDAVVLEAGARPRTDWLAALQHTASQRERVGIVAPKLVGPDGRIRSAGMEMRDSVLVHRYCGAAADYGPAVVAGPVLAVAGECLYLTREFLAAMGGLEALAPVAHRARELCAAAWERGFSVEYSPHAEVVVAQLAPPAERDTTSTMSAGDSPRAWQSAGASAVRGLEVIYVTEATGIAGGHRDVFEHLDGLRDRGYEAELWTLGDPPDWFPLRAPVRQFQDLEELRWALEPRAAIKVATWWQTAETVWRASRRAGMPLYFVQDIETSYYLDAPRLRNAVLASYRPEFAYLTISSWNAERLAELGLDPELIPPGIDLETFRPLPEISRREDMVLALGRSIPLKNLPLTLAAWRSLRTGRPELCLFGSEPELSAGERGIRYALRPTDTEVNRLLNEATVFVQTSVHEGFCLPPLEAMAAGCPVVCTDAHGNRDFCRDGVNCLMPAPEPRAVAAAIDALLIDPALRSRLVAEGLATAAKYGWGPQLDALDAFMRKAATGRGLKGTT